MENLELLNLKIPASWSIFVANLEDLLHLRILDVEALVEAMFLVPEQYPISINFQNAGYSTRLFILNAQNGIFLYFL